MAESTETPEKENQRKYSRRRTLFGGAVFNAEGKKTECAVSDISETGVKVRGDDLTLEVGTFVELKINKFNILRRAEVMWNREGAYGLQFTQDLNRNDENLQGLFGIFSSN